MNIKKENRKTTKILVSVIAIFMILISMNIVSAATNDNVPVGVSEDISQPIELVGDDNMAQSFLWKGNGGYVAHGVGLWLQGGSSAGGYIKISDIPTGATVKRAFLYWSTWEEISPPVRSVTVNSNPISEVLIGTKTESDPAWGNVPHTYRGYRADISSIVRGNGVYKVSGFPTGYVYDKQNTMGTSIVVVYSLPTAPLTTIVINDGMVVLHARPQSYFTTLTGFVASSSPIAKLTLVAGQGEAVWTLDWEYFNGRQLAQNGLDASDGAVWDTDTYSVSSLIPAGSRSAVAKVAMKNDWIGWVATVLSVTSPPSVITVNLLKNPGFDILSGSLPQYWAKSQTGTKAVFTYPAPGRVGGRAVAIRYPIREAGKVALWQQTGIVVVPSKQYKLSGYMKLEGVTGGGALPRYNGAGIRINWYTSANVLIRTDVITKSGTLGWTKYEKTFTSPANAAKATVAGDLFNAAGKVTFDDMSLVKVS